MIEHCFKCGIPFDNPESIIPVGGNKYHKACNVELVCDTCNKTIGFLDGILESSHNMVSCISCSKPWICKNHDIVQLKLYLQ